MIVSLHDISKRFNYEWIFRNIRYTFTSDHAYAITGPNGSGKSTLLRIIAGQLIPSGGKINFAADTEIPAEEMYQYVSYAAPYLDLIDEFTLDEILHFHASFMPWRNDLTHESLISLSELKAHRNKVLKTYSSGMRQRVKLLLAICSHTPLLILDEPTTNLDAKAIDWYLELIRQHARDRIILVGSNQEREYGFCQENLDLLPYKS